ncbi:MAG: cell division protein FtsL [Acidobacteriia bacterium]|nr:cell division protein FtsL [Terriglobia bacterium]
MNDIFFLKQVDNSCIRKEIDHAWIARFGTCLALISLFVGALLAQEWERVQIREMGYQMERVRAECDEIQGQNHLLQVERASLRSPQRIDQIARNDLGMTPTSARQVMMLDAGSAADQPVMAQAQATPPVLTSKSHVSE